MSGQGKQSPGAAALTAKLFRVRAARSAEFVAPVAGAKVRRIGARPLLLPCGRIPL